MSSMSSSLTRLPTRAAMWSATHPWRAIALWFAFVAASVAVAIAVPTVTTKDADYRIGESGRAADLIAQGHFPSANRENVLITSSSGTVPAEVAERAANELGAQLRNVAGVKSVGSPAWSPGPHRPVAVVGCQRPGG